jgi:hypothetical protein
MTLPPIQPLAVIEDLEGRERPFVVVTLFTPGYLARCECLRADCARFGLPFVACEVARVHISISASGGDDPATTKPALIGWALARYGKPILYIDSDCRVVLEPVLISDIIAKGHDFAAYNWLADPQTDGFKAVSVLVDGTPVTDRYFRFAIAIDYYATDQLMISGTTQFYAPTAAARALLACWQETIVAIPGTLDDGCLAYAFNNAAADRFGLRPYWLPKACTSLRPPARPCNTGYIVDTLEKMVLCIDATGTLVPAGKSKTSFWLPRSA